MFPVFFANGFVVLFHYDQDIDIAFFFEMSGCCAAEDDYRDYILLYGGFYNFDQGLDVGVHGEVLMIDIRSLVSP